MCQIARQIENAGGNCKPQDPSRILSSFESYRLNSSTFRLVEDDAFGENPFIYVKLYPEVIVLVDAGCNAPRQTDRPQTSSLREFLETIPVPENGNRPLNPGGHLPYLILLTHCHYDHTGGIINFSDTENAVVAVGSAFKSQIVEKGHLHRYSLHEELNLPPPSYPANFRLLEDGEIVHYTTSSTSPKSGFQIKIDLGLRIVATPGHSIDSIVILDLQERVVFLGDSAYEIGSLFYAYGSDLQQQADSLGEVERLLIDGFQPTSTEEQVEWIAACGHYTAGVNAVDLLRRVQRFILDVLGEKLSPEIGRDHIGREQAALIKHGDLAMAVPMEQLVASVQRFKGLNLSN